MEYTCQPLCREWDTLIKHYVGSKINLSISIKRMENTYETVSSGIHASAGVQTCDVWILYQPSSICKCWVHLSTCVQTGIYLSTCKTTSISCMESETHSLTCASIQVMEYTDQPVYVWSNTRSMCSQELTDIHLCKGSRTKMDKQIEVTVLSNVCSLLCVCVCVCVRERDHSLHAKSAFMLYLLQK